VSWNGSDENAVEPASAFECGPYAAIPLIPRAVRSGRREMNLIYPVFLSSNIVADNIMQTYYWQVFAGNQKAR
jgi:hypothetical protein